MANPPLKSITSVVLFPLCFLALAGMACSPPGVFSVRNLYSKQGFCGADLAGGRVITVSPVFTPQGRINDGELSSPILLPLIAKRRHSLRLQPSEPLEERFKLHWNEDALDSFYMNLYKGNMIELQSAVQAWRLVDTDYLMSLRLTWGLRVKGGSQRAARRIRLEGELWDCDSAEVVWRVSVDGYTRGERFTDRQILSDAVCRVFEALPPLTPGYGKGKW